MVCVDSGIVKKEMDLAKDDANAEGNGIKEKTFRVGDRANDVEIEDRVRESDV